MGKVNVMSLPAFATGNKFLPAGQLTSETSFKAASSAASSGLGPAWASTIAAAVQASCVVTVAAGHGADRLLNLFGFTSLLPNTFPETYPLALPFSWLKSMACCAWSPFVW